MATHSSILACRITWTEDPGELQSMGLQRVRHDGVTKHNTDIYYIHKILSLVILGIQRQSISSL